MPLGSYDFKGKWAGRLKCLTNSHATAPVLTVPAHKVWNVKAVSMTTTANAANYLYCVCSGATLQIWSGTLAERTLETKLANNSLDLWLEEGDTVNGVSNTAGVLTVMFVEYDA